MKPTLQNRAILIGGGVAALVLLLLGITLRGGKGAQQVGLSVTFLGLTNNPVAESKRYGLWVPGSAKGTCALFRFKNMGSRSIAFDTVGVEELTAEGWRAFRPKGKWEAMSGCEWPSGSSCLVATGWPPGLSTSATWRISLRWGSEFINPAKLIHEWLGRAILNYHENLPFVGHSSPVKTTAPNQGGAANRSQPGGSQTNGTSAAAPVLTFFVSRNMRATRIWSAERLSTLIFADRMSGDERGLAFPTSGFRHSALAHGLIDNCSRPSFAVPEERIANKALLVPR